MGDALVLKDVFGRTVRLSDERFSHILEHPEMAGLSKEIERVLRMPKVVRRSRSDSSVLLFYEFLTATIFGDKWLCVVVKYQES
ncbi:MAG TPA: hypothetical protein PKH07_14965, partial [bacterium]|nr:hypothetical protein [bacterium]